MNCQLPTAFEGAAFNNFREELAEASDESSAPQGDFLNIISGTRVRAMTSLQVAPLISEQFPCEIGCGRILGSRSAQTDHENRYCELIVCASPPTTTPPVTDNATDILRKRCLRDKTFVALDVNLRMCADRAIKKLQSRHSVRMIARVATLRFLRHLTARPTRSSVKAFVKRVSSQPPIVIKRGIPPEPREVDNVVVRL